MFRKYLIGFVAVLITASLVLSACTGKKTEPPKPADPAPVAPAEKKPAVGGEIVVQVPADPDTFAHFWLSSSYASYVTTRIFGGGLLSIGYGLTPEPNLAEAMPEVSADSKVYTVKLRKNIKFHDGTPVTAHDIKFAYDILMSPDYIAGWKSTVAPIASVEVVDDYTMKFTTTEVFAPFLFGALSVPPMPRHILKDVAVKDLQGHDFWKKPVGAGSYKFVEWKPGQYTLLERNPDYFKYMEKGHNDQLEGPHIERVRFKVIPEQATAVAALEAGEISLYSSFPAAEVERINREYKDRLIPHDWDRMGYGYQTFNNQLWPTDIKEVRQALSYALNREVIIKGLLDGRASLPAGFVPPIHWVYNPDNKGYLLNPTKAAELLAQAGFKKNSKGILEKDGKELKLKYVATKGNALIDGIALQSQKDWGALGVELELIMVDFNTLLDKHLNPGDYHVTFSGLGFSVDPHYSFNAWHSREIRLDAAGIARGGNRARYTNAEVDRLVDLGKVTVDVAERKKIYQQAEKIIIDDAPANWIYVNLWTDYVLKDFKGVINQNGYGVLGWTNFWYTREQ